MDDFVHHHGEGEEALREEDEEKAGRRTPPPSRRRNDGGGGGGGGEREKRDHGLTVPMPGHHDPYDLSSKHAQVRVGFTLFKGTVVTEEPRRLAGRRRGNRSGGILRIAPRIENSVPPKVLRREWSATEKEQRPGSAVSVTFSFILPLRPSSCDSSIWRSRSRCWRLR